MTLAKASGGQLLPAVLEFSTSFEVDKALVREDLLGSLAHITMLGRQNLLPKAEVEKIRTALVELWQAQAAGTLALPLEEDVHMAVESWLSQKLGETSRLLHTARSRNDQVNLDLHLHVREQLAFVLSELSQLLLCMLEFAERDLDLVMPGYTHRQRAQPISVAYWWCAYASMLARDLDAFSFVRTQVDAMPLGVGAMSGTSLAIDRDFTAKLLQFSRITLNGLDTVGDRDFALDYTYAGARFLTHASRFSAEVIEFCTSEFGFIKLSDEVSFGSSMMPQKRNPDIFELIRGKSSFAIGNVTSLFILMKGLAAGYHRDLQEDRAPILNTGATLRAVLPMLRLMLPHIHFDKDRMLSAVTGDYLQATDLAEALVMRGIAFRTAYQMVGKVVQACRAKQLPLRDLTLEMAQAVDARFDASLLQVLSAPAAVARKQSRGGTGEQSVREQIQLLRARAQAAAQEAAQIPTLSSLFAEVKEVRL